MLNKVAGAKTAQSFILYSLDFLLLLYKIHKIHFISDFIKFKFYFTKKNNFDSINNIFF